jgi:hypothetical protein
MDKTDQPSYEIPTTSRQRFTQHPRIRDHEVRGRERLDALSREKRYLLLRFV